MIAADSSVAVPAALPWHQAYDEAVAAIDGGDRIELPAHAAIETYAVLTRLPPPHRLPPAIALEYLHATFGRKPLTLSAVAHQRLLQLAASEAIVGGAIYDAVVAATALEAGATLLTLDRRAERVYDLVGVDYRFVA